MQTRPAVASGPAEPPAQLAKAALLRLAKQGLEPTPENFARAYLEESGEPAAAPVVAADGPALASLIDRIVRGVERGGRNWTAARRKDGLRRVLEGSRSDAGRLQQRLSQLVSSWDSDVVDRAVDTAFGELEALEGAPGAAPPPKPVAPEAAAEWRRAVTPLGDTVCKALPETAGNPHELAGELAALTLRLQAEGATLALVERIESVCDRAGPVLQHRHRLVDQLSGLCLELTSSLTDLAENDSWAQGQCDAMRVKIEEGLTSRGVRAVSEMLRDTRERHGRLRADREQARDALKGLIHQMLSELDALGAQTGQFHESVGRYATAVEKADTLESLAGAVREMVEESRTVQSLVEQTQTRLSNEHRRATDLTQRVSELEHEMRRLSDEVSTDQLTQVANRRGLLLAFDAERAQVERLGEALAIGLLDIDNFKRLNDELGHAAGDEALKALAAAVGKTLRPTDRVARYGGEEFVVMLPSTPLDEAQQILTRLQRSLSGGLFLHDQKPVFVTFSAGVTAYRAGERIEEALERADQALYEAKRTGKNRTCTA